MNPGVRPVHRRRNGCSPGSRRRRRRCGPPEGLRGRTGTRTAWARDPPQSVAGHSRFTTVRSSRRNNPPIPLQAQPIRWFGTRDSARDRGSRHRCRGSPGDPFSRACGVAVEVTPQEEEDERKAHPAAQSRPLRSTFAGSHRSHPRPRSTGRHGDLLHDPHGHSRRRPVTS
jgi:hypothetical protein